MTGNGLNIPPIYGDLGDGVSYCFNYIIRCNSHNLNHMFFSSCRMIWQVVVWVPPYHKWTPVGQNKW